jgi:hypothetical protein
LSSNQWFDVENACWGYNPARINHLQKKEKRKKKKEMRTGNRCIRREYTQKGEWKRKKKEFHLFACSIHHQTTKISKLFSSELFPSMFLCMARHYHPLTNIHLLIVTKSRKFLTNTLFGRNLGYLRILQFLTTSLTHFQVVNGTKLLEQSADFFVLAGLDDGAADGDFGGRCRCRCRGLLGGCGRSFAAVGLPAYGTAGPLLARLWSAAFVALGAIAVGFGGETTGGFGFCFLGFLSFSLLFVLESGLAEVLITIGAGKSHTATRSGSSGRGVGGLGTGDLASSRAGTEAVSTDVSGGDALVDESGTAFVFALEV